MAIAFPVDIPGLEVQEDPLLVNTFPELPGEVKPVPPNPAPMVPPFHTEPVDRVLFVTVAVLLVVNTFVGAIRLERFAMFYSCVAGHSSVGSRGSMSEKRLGLGIVPAFTWSNKSYNMFQV